MSKKKDNELKNKSNEELCALIVRLKFRLLEARFKIANGEMEKLHLIKQIRRTIAAIYTELRLRNYGVSIGNHGLALHNLTDHTTVAISNQTLEKYMVNDDVNQKPSQKNVSKKQKVEDKKDDGK